jgi:hypothetical protein
VTDAAVATEVHQTLDVHRDLAAQVTLDLKIRDRGTKLRDFRFSQIFHGYRRINAGRRANLLGARITDSVDRRQCDHDVLVQRYIYA